MEELGDELLTLHVSLHSPVGGLIRALGDNSVFDICSVICSDDCSLCMLCVLHPPHMHHGLRP